VRWRRSTPRRGFAGDEEDDHDRGLGDSGKARARLGRHGRLNRGHNAGTGAPEGSEHGGVAQAQTRSGEQLRGHEGSNEVNKGMGRLLTSSADSAALG
jgi:hypothetical protein